MSRKSRPPARVPPPAPVKEPPPVDITEEKRRRKREARRRRQLMYLAAVVVLGMLVVAAVFYQPPTPARPPAFQSKGVVVGKVAPDLSLTDIDGSAFTLYQMRDRIVILSFIKSGELMAGVQASSLTEVYTSYIKKVAVVLVDVNPEKNSAALRELRANLSAEWKVASDTAGAGGAFKVNQTPTTLVVDRTGVIIHRTDGPVGADALRKDIDAQFKLGIEVGSTAPNFELTDVEGTRFSLVELRGKVVIIDFMATWCIPCKKEMAELKEVYAKYKDRGLEIVSIDVDPTETDSMVKDFRNTYADRWKFAVDLMNPAVTLTYKVDSLPALFIVNKSGAISFKGVGLTPASTLDAEIQKAL